MVDENIGDLSDVSDLPNVSVLSKWKTRPFRELRRESAGSIFGGVHSFAG